MGIHQLTVVDDKDIDYAHRDTVISIRPSSTSSFSSSSSSSFYFPPQGIFLLLFSTSLSALVRRGAASVSVAGDSRKRLLFEG